jgi:16S rRNA (uracil1498-N3)-methyltransferase
MTRRRWIADEVSGNRAALVGDHADHLVRVLRARVGQEFDIVADAVLRSGRIVTISDRRVDFELGEEISVTSSVPHITVLLSIFKFDRMEWAIEKATELGVSKIVPLVARRTDTHLASASIKRADRWKRIAIQAAEQSRRAAPPEMAAPVKLRDALSFQAGLKIVLSESEIGTHLRDILANHNSGAEVLLAIGPEGGWTEDELDLFQRNGWIPASLGATILRAETAAIAAVAIVLSGISE